MNEESPSVENPFAGQGSVLLDIGDDIGALVVTMPAGMAGREVEIRPAGIDGSHPHWHDHAHDQNHAHDHAHGHDHARGSGDHLAHVAVVNRPVGDRHVPSLVFPELVTGRYELFEKGNGRHVMLQAVITGGEVTSLTWPA
jgi:hypothetical protein